MKSETAGKESMTVFTPSTTETREIMGEGAPDKLSSMGDGVGIGTLRTRTDDQKAVYASRRGMKTSMVNVTQDWAIDNRWSKSPKNETPRAR